MDIVDKFVKYFYENNYTFDDHKEKLFRDQMKFARENYPKTDKFLNSYYKKCCTNKDNFILPMGVFRILFSEVWPPLGLMWIRGNKLKKVKTDGVKK